MYHNGVTLNGRHAREAQVILEALVSGKQPPTVESLRREFGVSIATIYNDIDLLSRVRLGLGRGVVEAKIGGEQTPERFQVQAEVKRHIADRMVRDHVATGSVVFIDTGSTCFYFAKSLSQQGRADVGVITSNPFVVHSLATSEFGGEVLCLGGTLRPQAASLHGRLTVDALSQLAFDIAVVSVDFVHADALGTLAIFSDAEAPQKRLAMSKASRLVIVLVDDSKLGRKLGNVVGSLQDIASRVPVILAVGMSSHRCAAQTVLDGLSRDISANFQVVTTSPPGA